MKNSFVSITANIVSILCLGAACYMAINSIEGWGWFLFGALVTYGVHNVNS